MARLSVASVGLGKLNNRLAFLYNAATWGEGWVGLPVWYEQTSQAASNSQPFHTMPRIVAFTGFPILFGEDKGLGIQRPLIGVAGYNEQWWTGFAIHDVKAHHVGPFKLHFIHQRRRDVGCLIVIHHFYRDLLYSFFTVIVERV